MSTAFLQMLFDAPNLFSLYSIVNRHQHQIPHKANKTQLSPFRPGGVCARDKMFHYRIHNISTTSLSLSLSSIGAVSHFNSCNQINIFSSPPLIGSCEPAIHSMVILRTYTTRFQSS
ncbi:hypothetical protein, unlikely [Trypanosoma brucei gambiense DAL972]|uniref:Uncharacterized protein n=1 Tax=Trypanosoma brucei gambiense (strain MHOM/CI/86/DAL972) TaxID=679716 RepID=D0A3B9_TRYB9|nr:hypothetical protein, unlikely [Trypanosoma brucei gambiense DAL972]CBH15763.1 hypothetical protein, unlikely [Trypanosoma brucei gambiense DAL972]|eukprot:XP_011778027.1 hypothetical protein, unlikely [Trypanosoma brucei gambiense DAL972]